MPEDGIKIAIWKNEAKRKGIYSFFYSARHIDCKEQYMCQERKLGWWGTPRTEYLIYLKGGIISHLSFCVSGKVNANSIIYARVTLKLVGPIH